MRSNTKINNTNKKSETPDSNILEKFQEIHCITCGRFLGFEHIKKGEIILLCKKCKGWTRLIHN